MLDAWGIVPHAGLQPVALMPGLRPAPPRRLIPSRNEGIPPVIAGVGVVPDLGHGSRLGSSLPCFFLLACCLFSFFPLPRPSEIEPSKISCSPNGGSGGNAAQFFCRFGTYPVQIRGSGGGRAKKQDVHARTHRTPHSLQCALLVAFVCRVACFEFLESFVVRVVWVWLACAPPHLHKSDSPIPRGRPIVAIACLSRALIYRGLGRSVERSRPRTAAAGAGSSSTSDSPCLPVLCARSRALIYRGLRSVS